MDFSHHPYYSPVAASTNLAVHDLAWERALFLLTELCKGEPVSSLRSKFAPHPGITSDHVKIARYLLDKGLDADADYYNDGHVPLQLAARGHGDAHRPSREHGENLDLAYFAKATGTTNTSKSLMGLEV